MPEAGLVSAFGGPRTRHASRARPPPPPLAKLVWAEHGLERSPAGPSRTHPEAHREQRQTRMEEKAVGAEGGGTLAGGDE